MSDAILKPKIDELIDGLDEVTNWFHLGVYLHIPYHKLTEIESKNKGLVRCKIDLFNTWLSQNPNASWIILIDALKKMDENNTVAKLQIKHMKQSPNFPQVLFRPTVQCLMEDLVEVTDWYLFGIYLGVPKMILEGIRSRCGDIDQCKIALFEVWLQDNLQVTWREIIDALKMMFNESDDVIVQLEKKYIKMYSNDQLEDNNALSKTVQVSSPVLRELLMLEAEHAKLMTDIQSEIRKNVANDTDFILFLKEFMQDESFGECHDFDSAYLLLRRKHAGTDVFNNDVIHVLLSIYNKSALTLLENYNKSVQSFLENTKVKEFECALRSRSFPNQPEGMRYICLKLHAPWPGRTLQDLQSLIHNVYKIHAKAFFKPSCVSGCVHTTWFIPESVIPAIVDITKKYETAKIFWENKVEEAIIEGEGIFNFAKMFILQRINSKEPEVSPTAKSQHGISYDNIEFLKAYFERFRSNPDLPESSAFRFSWGLAQDLIETFERPPQEEMNAPIELEI